MRFKTCLFNIIGSTVQKWKVYIDNRLREERRGSLFSDDGRLKVTDGLKAGEIYTIKVTFLRTGGKNEEIELEQEVRLSK